MTSDNRELFKGAAVDYVRFRAGYPKEIFDYIVDYFHLDGKGKLLDLGCGTGQITILLVPRFEKAIGIDIDKNMNNRIKKLIYWVPRILSLLFVAFLSIFSFDVFDEYQGWEVIIPLFMHNLPSLVLLTVVILAWKKYDLIGAAVFLALAILWLWLAGFDRPWSSYVLIFGPAFLVSILFFLNWFIKRRGEVNNSQ